MGNFDIVPELRTFSMDAERWTKKNDEQQERHFQLKPGTIFHCIELCFIVFWSIGYFRGIVTPEQRVTVT